MRPTTSATTVPTRFEAAWFWLRSRRHIVLRAWRNAVVQPVRRWPQAHALCEAPVLAEVRTPLWDADPTEDEFALVAGKVHNLRLAVAALNGAEVPAGGLWSFWTQLGRLSRGRGYVLGREVREGCVIPSLGGGICQITNALATCAARAGLALVERHGHTMAVAPGAASGVGAASSLDATVFWNYVDLRLQSAHPWRLELGMDATHLWVRLRGTTTAQPPAAMPSSARRAPIPIQAITASPPLPAHRSCLTCGQGQCFRHRAHAGQPRALQGTTAVLLDAWMPEWADYLQTAAAGADIMVPRAPRWRGLRVPGRAAWAWPPSAPVAYVAWGTFVMRAVATRWQARSGGQRQAAVLAGQHALARAYARQLRPEHTHPIVDQALLVPLWQAGHLAGRHYTVLMHSLPMHAIQQQLQRAAAQWPTDATLRDFRAPDDWLTAEQAALAGAERVVTPHHGVAQWAAQQLPGPVTTLPWHTPTAPTASQAPSTTPAPHAVVLGCSALGRKGWQVLCQALKDWTGEVRVLGTLPPGPAPAGWHVRAMPHHAPWWQGAAVVVIPAYVEHQPRAALQAQALGLPVVVTDACGLPWPPHTAPGAPARCSTVPAGDATALRAALAPWLPG